jgi:hypothetical protein
VLDHLDLPGHHQVNHCSGGVHWGIVPMEPPASSCYHRPILLENLHELAQGIFDVVGVHCVPPGYVIGVNEALGMEKAKTI